MDNDDQTIPLPKFEIKKLCGRGVDEFFKLDIAVDNCAICRNHIMDLCIDCQSTQSTVASSSTSNNHPDLLSNSQDFPTEPLTTTSANSDECVVAWGQCSHAFHNHCISRWLKTRKVCPLDNKEWVYAPQSTFAPVK